ncbi:Peroxin-3 [Auricularia subglabra TFB-10046 SS5]|nr:Peroxin-3 [Auricularia subglabra TFB-10046 SS5]
MFPSIRRYVYDRRRGLALTAGVVGSVYLLGRYVVARLEEIRDKVLQDRAARDNLRRRFVKNQEDMAFSVLALLQPLGTTILEAMDVERLTAELRALSSRPLPAPAAQDDDARSTATDDSAGGRMAESAGSWVDQFTSQSQASLVGDSSNVQLAIPQPSTAGGNGTGSGHASGDSPRSTDVSMSSSMLSDTTSESSAGTGSKSKAELWREVKIMAFARTLTVAYASTLLALLTHVQLSLLGRHKYIASVKALSREAAQRDRALFDANVASLFSDFALPGQQEDRDGDDADAQEEEITDELERAYLTLSWWLLNEGWREVASRVQRAVEDVFEPVSLKTQLSIDDLSQLVRSVHTRVHIGDNFLPALLPPTPEQLARILPTNPSSSPVLQTLLDETRARLRGADFAVVLRAALERAEAVLLAALEEDLFKPDDLAAPSLEESFGPRIREIPTKRVRLAALLPGVARWAHAAVQGYPNELVDAVARLHEVEVFCAIVYSAYDDELVAAS